MKAKHPIQPLILDPNKVIRFKHNAIVRYMLDLRFVDLNKLAMLPFSEEDRQQFAQLIGYSLCGYEELSYVTDAEWERALTEQPKESKKILKLMKEGK